VIDFHAIDALTFDCYGTLIDWETGLLGALEPVLRAHGVTQHGNAVLELYARHEARLEAGPYAGYRHVLAGCLQGIGHDLGFTPTEAELDGFARSPAGWPAFQDSAAALARLHGRFPLGVITNCDDDLFASSQRRLRIEFDWVVTAQQVRSYKPALSVFEHALRRIGVAREHILHVAQSIFHDVVPARELGLRTVWVKRRQDRQGFGATPPATATPDLTVPDLRTLAELATA
jgi:2-haloacid dehalogenase